MACHNDCPLISVRMIIIRQKRLTVTVSAFFSDRYFLMVLGRYADFRLLQMYISYGFQDKRLGESGKSVVKIWFILFY